MAASILPQRCPHCIDDPRIFLAPKPKGKLIDIEGQGFHRLTAEHFIGIAGVRKAYWCCLCECGEHVIVIGSQLRNGNTKSCGCWEKDFPGHRTHGMTHTPEFRTWQGMIQRCTNPDATAYAFYGGRGITICAEWLVSFEAFYADMGPRPPGMSIERRKNEVGYIKDNCYWGTRIEQANNKRTSRLITWNDETLTLGQWARKTGQSYATLFRRLKAGWSLEDVFSKGHFKTGVRPLRELI